MVLNIYQKIMTDRTLNVLQEKFPFLTLYHYGDEELIGLVQNAGKHVVSVYVYNKITDPTLRKHFIELAQTWWEESNRRIPINLFFKQDFNVFAPYVCNYVTKEFNVISGHMVSLQTLNSKRVKRRRIEIVVKNK